MSTDTKYFNSSRLLSASSKNKTNGVTRLDKKQSQAEKKNKVRQETVDIPQPQMLPNGGKPDFGHSGSRRKQKNGSGRHSSSSGSEGKKASGKQPTAQQVTKDLKGLFIKTEETGKGKGNVEKNRRRNEGRSVSASSSGSSTAEQRTTISAGMQSPQQSAAPSMNMPQSMNPVCSPLFARPGLYPPPAPPSAPHNANQLYPEHHYGNYSLTSQAPAPQFMTPQAPLINPMYPQLPLAQLPVVYKALDIQQQQLQQQQHLQQQHQQQQAPSQYLQHQPNFQQYSPPQPQQFSQPNMALPYSLPLSASYCENPKVTAVKPLETKKPKKGKAKATNTSTCFAGASFASSDPKVNKLPKPSFTKA